MFDTGSIEVLLEAISRHDGSPPLSDAKLGRIGQREAVTVVAEGDDLVAVGVTATHRHADGSMHWAVETAVTPSLQFAAFERSVLSATLATVPRGSPVSVWSSRSSLASALEDLGFRRSRTLAYLTVGLPLPSSLSGSDTDAELRPFHDEDVDALIRINNAAFAGHREAGTMTRQEFDRLSKRPGIDPEGIIVASSSDAAAQIIGFCWTKVHTDGDGEIFRIAVDPPHHGRGLGRALLLAGFARLSGNEVVRRGSLWVDEANVAAMALYRDIGMSIDRENSEFEPAQGNAVMTARPDERRA